MYEEYVEKSTITKLRMFYETMEDVLPGMKIVIDNGDGTQKILPLDSFTGENNQEDTQEQSSQQNVQAQTDITGTETLQGGE